MPVGLLILNQEQDVLYINNRTKNILSINGNFTNLKELSPLYDPFTRLITENNFPKKKKDLFFKLKERILYLEVLIDRIESDETLTCITIIDKTSDLKKIDSIKSMQDELSQFKNLAAIGTMISGIAHELNNPISGISMSSQLAENILKEAIENISNSENTYKKSDILDAISYTIDEISYIKLNTVRAAKLVGGLLNYSRKERLDLELCNLKNLVTETLELTKTQPVFLNADISVELNEDIQLNCDKQKVQQVLFNIIKNAVESIEKVGRVSIVCKKENDYVKISVSDNGCGVEPANINQIFTPFFTTKSSKGGTGLGLSISHRIVERHGGKITFRSTPKEGSEFVITLPLNLE